MPSSRPARRLPEITDLELSHLPLRIAGTPFDFAIRVGRQRESPLHARLPHPNRRVVCAAPGYLSAPESRHDLPGHDCIVIRENGSDYARWRFATDGDEAAVKVPDAMISDDGEIATPWRLAGHGLSMRSPWNVAPMPRSGELVPALADIPAPEAPIYAGIPSGGTAVS